MRGFLVYCIFILSVLIIAPFSLAEELDRVVAVINGEAVTSSELKETIKLTNSSSEVGIKKMVLEEIINMRLVAQEADKLGIKVKNEEIEEAIKDIIKKNGITLEKLKEDLAQQGSSYQYYKNWLRRQILKNKLVNLQVQTKVTVTDEEIKRYYEAHIDQYEGYTGFHLRHILLSNPLIIDYKNLTNTQQEILKQLKEGVSFSELAKNYSEAPTAKDGGDLGWIKEKDLIPEIKEVVTSLHPGEISQWIKTKAGFQLIQLVERKEVPHRTILETKKEIYGIFYQKKVEQRYQNWLRQLREQAYIKILL
jgi:peptidyl-prolyl cis-trans isomerase SurA